MSFASAKPSIAGHLVVHQGEIEGGPSSALSAASAAALVSAVVTSTPHDMQMLLQYFAIAGVVVHDERAQAGEIQPLQASQGRGRFSGRQPHLEPECRRRGRRALWTPISPPIKAASCVQMASPKPVPPYFRVVNESAWLKELNMRPWTSSRDADARVDDLESQQAIRRRLSAPAR